jgi:hypothetical protein
MRRLIFSLLLLLTAPYVFAEGGEFAVVGLNQLTCGKYVQDLASNQSAKAMYGWWIAGFITGTNLVKDRITTSDVPAHEVWLKNYCERNLLDPFIKAAIKLHETLDKR